MAVLVVYSLLLFLVVARTKATCDPSEYQVYPETNSFYGVLGEVVNFTAYRGLPYTASIRLSNRTTNPNGETIECTGSTCTLDQDSGQLVIHDFKPTYAGQYSLVFRAGLATFCTFEFSLTQAFAPTLTSAVNTTVTIDADSGPLTLQPTVFHGVPPGIVQWYRDGVNISTSDSYSTDTAVQPIDRGIYTANISNFVDTAILSYTVFVRFAPVIMVSATPVQGTSNVFIRCDTISYPAVDTIVLLERSSDGVFREVTTGLSVNIDRNLRTSTFDFESNITYTVTECPPKVFECKATLNGVEKASRIGICQTTPNVTGLHVLPVNSTNSSVFLTWTLQPSSVTVDNYFYEFRRTGSSQWTRYTNGVQCIPTRTHCLIEGLDSGVSYEFRVRANNTVDTGPYTDVISFTTFAAPQGIPLHLSVKRNESNGIQQLVLEWQAVPSLSHSPVMYYQVSYNNGPNTPTLINNTDQPHFTLRPVLSSQSYFLQVRAVNQWGVSSYSAKVESTATNVIDPNGRVRLNVNVSVSDTFVVLRWSLTEPSSVATVTIIINELEIRSSGIEAIVTTTEVYTHVTMPTTIQSKCFSGLNSRDQYQFCVIATLLSGANKTNCTVTSTSTSYRGLEDANNCENIRPLTGGSSLIPTWSIVVLVVGSVVIVFFVFGGCGLYYGIKRNQKGGADFESPQPSMEDVNGYPYPSKRAPSPSRSCMSYRHNQQHQHGIDWRVTNPIDPRQDITEV